MPLPQFDMAPFIRPVAHRGLHDATAGIIENTGPAFEAAIAAGYAIECDLRASADGDAFVFHDKTFARLVDSSATIATTPSASIATLRYRANNEPVLSFSDLLALVDGRVPMLVEIKSEWEPPDARFIAHLAALARTAPGPLAVMSFDPAVLRALAAAAPHMPRGIIAGRYQPPGWWSDVLSPARQAALSTMTEAWETNPAFIAWCVDHLPDEHVAAARTRGLPVFAWTVRNADQLATAQRFTDAPIFERPVNP